MRLYDYGLGTLSQYDLTAERSARTRGALLCYTEQGLLILREFHSSEKKLKKQQELLAALIFCEAGNQPYKGQVAVGAVVLNRIKSKTYPDSMKEVIYQRGQFGPAGSGWLNRVLQNKSYTKTAWKAAADALKGKDPINGCLYFNQGGSGKKIGDHYFH